MALASRATLLVALLMAWPLREVAATGSIAGRVTAGDDGKPLLGASVYLQGSVRGTTTDSRGEYRLGGLAPGTYTLVFSMVGYHRATLPGILVEDGGESRRDVTLTPDPIQTEQVVVTASKRPQSLEEVPVSMSILESGDIQRRNALAIDEALRYIPGVTMVGNQVNIRGSSGYSRGAGSRVLMLLDGIPLLTGDTGELNFESIPVGQIDRIEVVKGASSALYGSSALGGVINVITKPIPETAETVIRTYGGLYNEPSYDQWRWTDGPRFSNGQSFSHARTSGDLGVSLFVSRQFDDGYRLNDYRRRYNVHLKVREELSTANSLTMSFGMLYQYGGQFVYWRNLDSALIPPVLQQNDNVKSMRYFVNGLYSGALSDKVLLSASVLWYHNDWGYETIRGIGRTESLSDDLRAEVHSTVLLDPVHTITAGVEGLFDVIGADAFGTRTVGGFAFYAQDELRLSDAFSATVGARFDFQSLGLVESGGQLNPKAALSFAPFAGTTIRASFGRGFRVPSVAEAFISAGASNLTVVPNENLRPERSYSYEAGLSQRLGSVGVFDIAAFRSEYYDLIEAGLVSSGTTLLIQWQNITRARIQGVETTLKLRLFDGGLTYDAGYTYVDPQDLTLDDVLKYRPRHVFYTSLTGRLAGVFAMVDFRYLSRVERIDEMLVEVGIVPDGDERVSIYVTDVRLGTDIPLGDVLLGVTASVNNVFQHNYVELIANIMPPRTYVLVLEARF